ncbi:cytochrome c maturation protein CcmE [Halomonas sp. 18H]|uniref:cytochrome c maturation protein CcmE n=1 Tax=Halomonas almeriensis TaxID=308163 RepID=UPI00222FB6E5|nr:MULTISPECIES: cytochrome c maturation protein CcmE [Halomonas]MCW4149667.1 cytochrome c maturation protein CcmE [Halomonas sp. 18H]MDN3553388.1 cytochrome c maturation protein CcmE [Halomonas almeriensis]
MRRQRRQRLQVILAMLVLAAIAAGLMLYALRSNINLFFSPMQVVAGEAPMDRPIRAGGLVAKDSVKRDPQSLAVRFAVTDHVESIQVRYRGILPDLFREGQGVVVLGELQPEGWVRADEVLARHDENYMPPEVADALKEAGYAPEDYRDRADQSPPPAGTQPDAGVE